MPWIKGQSGNKKGRPRGPKKPEVAKRSVRIGQDYLYVFEQKGYFKIGISNNPARRLCSVQASTPFDVNVVLVVTLNRDAEPVEKSLHDYFKEKHYRGEWYKLSKGDIRFIQSYAIEYNQAQEKIEMQMTLV